ncbi:hypothetical protein [Streptomyces sp. NPDC060194]|uniref:hypothetical protein n=1 Tax=Streptomyces sp. NPDC060194 TaxID=3347069 RepID=UPI00366894F6
MSKQKSRRQRRVNRTPRPVTASGAALVADRALPAARRADRGPDLEGVVARLGWARRGLPGQRATETAQSPATGPRPEPAARPEARPDGPSRPEPRPEVTPRPEPAGPVFLRPARDGGLGLPAHRTWTALRAAGPAGLDPAALAAAAGFTRRTVAKHLEGLVRHGLAAETAGTWVAHAQTDPADAPDTDR